MWLCKRWHVYSVPTSESLSWWHIQFWQSGWLEDMELEVRRLTTIIMWEMNKIICIKKKTKLGLIICKGCQTSTLLVNKPRNIQILTCLSFYLLAQETGAVRVLGSHWEHICLSTLQPIHHIESLSCGVVISNPTVSLGVDEVGHSAFWTWVPAYCDVIVSAICHSSHTSGWADD